jgi:hypothetical protein
MTKNVQSDGKKMTIEIVIVRIVTNVSLLVIGIIMNDVFVQVLIKKNVENVITKTPILENVSLMGLNVLKNPAQNDGKKTLSLEDVKTHLEGTQ